MTVVEAGQAQNMPSEQVKMINRLFSQSKRNRRGQSFVELMLVVLILMLMLAGVVEFSFMINSYIHVLDGSREAARVNNKFKAFDPTTWASDDFFYFQTSEQAASTMSPVVLNPNLGDDIIISVISLKGSSIRRYPLLADMSSSSNGWSLCGNYANYVAYYAEEGTSVLPELSDPGWNSCPSHESRLTNAEITARAGPAAMQSGLLVVEIIYNYSQILKLPIFSNGDFFGTKFSIVPDPLPLYIYTIMPMSSAEPTQVVP
jgi:hypothetical protein